MELYPNGVHLEVTRDANRPGKLAGRQPLTERRTETVTGIRQHTAEAHADRYQAINLRQCDLGLCPCSSIFDRNTGSLQPLLIANPTVWKKKPQGHHHRNFAAGECQRHQSLAVGGLALR